MKSILKKSLLILGITLGSIVLFFVGSITFFTLGRAHDLALQRRHLIELRQWYTTDEFMKVEESDFVSFSIDDPLIRFNEIQMLATHNSYKKMGSSLGKFFIGLGDSFDEAQSLKYSYDSLTSQFNVGIRSIELDIRFRNNEFEVVHVPLVDNRSNATNLELTLEEINLWSENHPQHIPIIILFELKNDWLILDPKLSVFTPAALEDLDQTITTAFGSKLYSPKHIIGSNENLKDAITSQGWPLLTNMLGKIVIVLHPGEFTQMYVDLDPGFTKMAMFPATENNDIDHSYTSFIIHNNPDVQAIRSLVDQNFIVRTGIDRRLTYTEEQYTKAISSGAQILTTDFPPNHNFKSTNYVPYLETRYTVIENKYIKEGE